MADEKEKAQRKMYVLPTELVERIAEFQEEKGLTSEVEAVRRLLDEALMRRDTHHSIIRRFKEKLQTVRIPAEAARDIIVTHPLVKEIRFPRNDIVIFIVETFDGSYKIQVQSDGSVLVTDPDDYDDRNWSRWVDPLTKEPSSQPKTDDDIPF